MTLTSTPRHGSERLLTCWVPVGDIPVEMGTLAVSEASLATGRRVIQTPLSIFCMGNR